MSVTVSPPRVPTTATVPVAADVVVALLSVNGATAAAERHGDVAMIAALQTYYGQVATALARAEGEVVKVMGDGVLVTFPRAGAREAVAALCLAQREANAHWQAFDAGCTVVVRATAGPVLRVAPVQIAIEHQVSIRPGPRSLAGALGGDENLFQESPCAMCCWIASSPSSAFVPRALVWHSSHNRRASSRPRWQRRSQRATKLSRWDGRTRLHSG
jgi:hypothetical protein